MLALAQTSESMLGRTIAAGVSRGTMGIDAIRESTQEHGMKEITSLHHRVAYIGFAASIAPMLGLLGTVLGMIHSFNVLGMAKGAARPDQLATGISEAMVTTCMGLMIAVPLMFMHLLLRGRVTRIGQEASGVCERLLRSMTVAHNARAAARPSRPSPPAERNT